MMDVLLKEVKKNLNQLKDMGMIKLSIGYNVIWDAHERCEVRDTMFLYGLAIDYC